MTTDNTQHTHVICGSAFKIQVQGGRPLFWQTDEQLRLTGGLPMAWECGPLSRLLWKRPFRHDKWLR